MEAEVYVKNNSASAICPSGASTGTFEAVEKRDKNNKKYLGKSVLSAINLVNTKISKELKGQSVHNQERIDTLLINLGLIPFDLIDSEYPPWKGPILSFA